MPSKREQFTFPPPGWPSNTVPPSSRKIPNVDPNAHAYAHTKSNPIPYSSLPSHLTNPPVRPPFPFINPYAHAPAHPSLNVRYIHPHAQHVLVSRPPPNPTFHPSPVHPQRPFHPPDLPFVNHHLLPFAPAPAPYAGPLLTPPEPQHYHNINPNLNLNSTSRQYNHQPQTAYQPVPAPNYRPPNYSQSTPTRSSYPNAMTYPSFQSQTRQLGVNGSIPPPSRGQYQYQSQTQQPVAYFHPQSYPPGVLPYFSAPPGQKTLDPSLNTPPTSQGLYTTYPSRLRTGITSLIQPEHITGGSKEREAFYAEQERELSAAQRGGSGTSTPRYDSPAPNSTKRPGFGGAGAGGRRTNSRVNYAEDASDDDEEDDEDEEELSELEEPDSDPDDDNYGSRRRPGTTRTSRRESGLVVGGYEHQLAMKAGKAKRKREEMDKGWTWLGDRTPAERVRSANARVTKHAIMSEELLEKEADRPELLVPITIDLDIPTLDPNSQGIRIKDRFLWNINEPFIDPLQFAQIFCDDVSISRDYATTISELIKNQLEESQNALEIDISNEDANEDDVIWSSEDEDEVETPGTDVIMALDPSVEPADGTAKGDKPKSNGTTGEVGNGDKSTPAPVEKEKEQEEEQEDPEEEKEMEKEKEWEEADCRIIVNLDVQIYTHILRDRIEWDLSSTLPPLLFAKQYCKELGLTGEAIPLITWAIHEELLKHKKDALELDMFKGTHPEEQVKFEKTGNHPRTNLATTRRGYSTGKTKGLNGVWRDWFDRDEYAPVLVELTFEEIIQREQERLRESRRVMRTLTTGSKRRRI
ncbi:uncharacterized protein I303_103102 [Kwoniella dejecticola CBS 10117]|uniref:Chromatin structure-remodeling complex subunit SFH1 n=1 Tax=Kwoniella dejecticola CBS 10117 TaxID=1296121 RepID=A0A1A6AAL0_9TREE|nr:uncharacterized protein I303_03122 [Kwoniella dejecticola CBS 10117]OBR87098.1 hypothetical protein I303_03122 [Kwoniella dejecticola CBS 10117]